MALNPIDTTWMHAARAILDDAGIKQGQTSPQTFAGMVEGLSAGGAVTFGKGGEVLIDGFSADHPMFKNTEVDAEGCDAICRAKKFLGGIMPAMSNLPGPLGALGMMGTIDKGRGGSGFLDSFMPDNELWVRWIVILIGGGLVLTGILGLALSSSIGKGTASFVADVVPGGGIGKRAAKAVMKRAG